MTSGTQSRRWGFIYIVDLLRVLVGRDFKLRYKRSVLGIAWSLLVPLAQLAVMYVVFNQLLRLGIPNYTSFLLAGILPWGWFHASITAASRTIVENRDLVKQVGFPITVLPAVTVLSQLVHFLLAVPILAVFLLADGFYPTLPMVALPLVIAVQFMLTASLAYLVAALQVTFRDTQHLTGIGLLLLSYMTPIFWDTSVIQGSYRLLFTLNPLACLLEAYRTILMGGRFPNPGPLAALTAVSTLALYASYWFFLHARDRFVEEL